MVLPGLLLLTPEFCKGIWSVKNLPVKEIRGNTDDVLRLNSSRRRPGLGTGVDYFMKGGKLCQVQKLAEKVGS